VTDSLVSQIIGALETASGPLTIRELAEKLDALPASVVNAIRRLESAHTVVRIKADDKVRGRALVSFRLATPGEHRACPRGFGILDTATGRLYVDVLFATAREAVAVLWDLLKPYDASSEWTRRLVVREVGAEGERAA
jgi:predicted ArsR family transcriptional regulator